ncbi:hypothetical protein Pd630_LPD04702 [Rhodococcus opacus PD630]|nr:hypothetical protein Pd630_LPD04702 [Rhodococcus opacus PD630]
MISEKSTKTSGAPLSGAMKPKILSPLNHFTMSCATPTLSHPRSGHSQRSPARDHCDLLTLPPVVRRSTISH